MMYIQPKKKKQQLFVNVEGCKMRRMDNKVKNQVTSFNTYYKSLGWLQCYFSRF